MNLPNLNLFSNSFTTFFGLVSNLRLKVNFNLLGGLILGITWKKALGNHSKLAKEQKMFANWTIDGVQHPIYDVGINHGLLEVRA